MIEPFQRRNLFEAQGLCIRSTFFLCCQTQDCCRGEEKRIGKEGKNEERGDKKEERRRDEGKEGKRRVEMYKNNVQNEHPRVAKMRYACIK